MFFTARIERPPLYRGGSASKKNGLPAPSHSSEAARCASTGIVSVPPAPFFSILLGAGVDRNVYAADLKDDSFFGGRRCGYRDLYCPELEEALSNIQGDTD